MGNAQRVHGQSWGDGEPGLEGQDKTKVFCGPNWQVSGRCFGRAAWDMLAQHL